MPLSGHSRSGLAGSLNISQLPRDQDSLLDFTGSVTGTSILAQGAGGARRGGSRTSMRLEMSTGSRLSGRSNKIQGRANRIGFARQRFGHRSSRSSFEMAPNEPEEFAPAIPGQHRQRFGTAHLAATSLGVTARSLISSTSRTEVDQVDEETKSNRALGRRSKVSRPHTSLSSSSSAAAFGTTITGTTITRLAVRNS